MGEQLIKYRRRKDARKSFEDLDKRRDMYIILHYSCESFYDIKDGRTPRVTSVAARNFTTGQTTSFSIHKSAEQIGVTPTDINQRYDELEKHMLDEYFEFIKSRHGYSFIHWNMRDINYGFQAIEHRYKVLGGEPFIIDDSRKFDLARALVNRFGPRYAPHSESGRLHSIMDLNRITAKDALTGKQEAEAFDAGEYVKLHQSTLRKVDLMSNILERILDGSIVTRATWREKTGYHPAVLIELVQEHWIWSIIAAFGVIAGLVGALKGWF